VKMLQKRPPKNGGG